MPNIKNNERSDAAHVNHIIDTIAGKFGIKNKEDLVILVPDYHGRKISVIQINNHSITKSQLIDSLKKGNIGYQRVNDKGRVKLWFKKKIIQDIQNRLASPDYLFAQNKLSNVVDEHLKKGTSAQTIAAPGVNKPENLTFDYDHVDLDSITNYDKISKIVLSLIDTIHTLNDQQAKAAITLHEHNVRPVNSNTPNQKNRTPDLRSRLEDTFTRQQPQFRKSINFLVQKEKHREIVREKRIKEEKKEKYEKIEKRRKRDDFKIEQRNEDGLKSSLKSERNKKR